MTKAPSTGSYIYGIYLEGGSWNKTNHCLSQPNLLELYSEMPLIHLKPVSHKLNDTGIYMCPIYKTKERHASSEEK